LGIKARGSLDLWTFDACYDPTLTAGGTFEIDLAEASFVDTYGLVAIACAARQAEEAGQEVVFTGPTDVNVARYLTRMHVPELLPSSADLPAVRYEEELPDRVLEVQSFDSEGDTERLAGLIYDKLKGTVNRAVPQALFDAICELGANVTQHANAPAGGLMAAQVFRRGRSDEYLVACVGDTGVGVRASLASRYSLASDADAIILAMDEGVSEYADPARGQGLPEVGRLVTGLGGQVVARSGDGRAAFSRLGGRPDTVSYLGGTLMGAKIPCRR
jgi:hypothetical protein